MCLSGEYPAVVRGATVEKLDDPGPSLQVDSYWSLGPRELAVVDSVVKLFWINLSIISVRAEICASRGSGLAFILSSTNSGDNLMLLSSLSSVIPVSPSPVFSSPCVGISGCVLNSYEFLLLNVLNSQEKLELSATVKLELGPICLMREYSFPMFTKSNFSLDVTPCIKKQSAVDCENGYKFSGLHVVCSVLFSLLFVVNY